MTYKINVYKCILCHFAADSVQFIAPVHTIFALYYIKTIDATCERMQNTNTYRENRRMNYFFYEHLYNKFKKIKKKQIERDIKRVQ